MVREIKEITEFGENIPKDHPYVVLYLWLRRCHDLITVKTDNNLLELNISQAQYHVLRILDDLGAVSMTEISKLLFRGKSNLTTLIDRMEKAGLVKRQADEEDRRVLKIEMTPLGQEIHDQVAKLHRSFLVDLFSSLTEEEIKQLNDLLKKLGKSLGHTGNILPK
ncbi:MAG: MarR family winged helix-turn-helix transcriptional regulator [Peptococcaceae bacterium]